MRVKGSSQLDFARMRHVLAIAAIVGCSGSSPAPVTPVKPAADTDPAGPHRAAIAAQIAPLIDAELATSIVVGINDAGRFEIYGFGKGPDGKPPTGRSLYELGAITKVYTALLLADSVQRREVDLETPASELLPPGVTMPVRDQQVITLRHLVNHSSGLPPLPPSLGRTAKREDPLAGYDENRLYADLVQTQLAFAPGQRWLVSEYGSGVLGTLLARKIGTPFEDVLMMRIIKPLALADTFITVPAAAAARRVQGTNQDLAPVKPWSWGPLAPAGALVSSARDQLTFLEAQMDAAAGGRTPPRPAMRFTQEGQLRGTGPNLGLGWQIDSEGRYWHNGTTNGFHSFIGFDTKQRIGIVILSSSSTPIVDQVAFRLYKVLANEPVKAPVMPTTEQLQRYAGTYDFSGQALKMFVEGKRMYVEGPGEPRIRMLPISDHEFWIHSLQAIVSFEEDAGKITRAVFIVGEQRMAAPRKD
jgi:serine-type D-Ala-D-Ala carboxypeptidase/endopeptidase